MLRSRSLVTVGVGVLLVSVLYGAPKHDVVSNFEKPTPEAALKFLKSLPRVARGRPGEYWVQQWKDFTVEDFKTHKVLQPGGHVEDPRNSKKTNTPHLHLYPWQWKYFTVFEALESFETYHDLEGIDDSCFFYLGQLPSKTMVKIHIAIAGKATGEGVRYLRNLKNLKSLTIKYSRDVTDVALVHAGEIRSLEYLDVNGCPAITGAGVQALVKLKKLKVLKIGGCSLSDTSLKHFRFLSVEELDLSDYVRPWIPRYRGGGKHRFTVSFPGLKRLLASKRHLPNLKRLFLKSTGFSREQKRELAKLRPGLVVK